MTDKAAILCPHCDETFEIELAEGFYGFHPQCPSCARTIREKPGECCVLCSHGDRFCPTQYDRSNCCNE